MMEKLMKRREFVSGSLLGLLGLVAAKSLTIRPAHASAAITEKDILKEGAPAPIANYCADAKKQPNKFCPGAKDRPGICGDCQFYLPDTKTKFKGVEYGKCQILATGPAYVAVNGWCATYTKRA